jgi:excisionase family DNA binding protein
MSAPKAAIERDGAIPTATAPAVAACPTEPTVLEPRNRHERRAFGVGHNHPPPEYALARDGPDGILAFPMSEVRARLGISRSKAYEEIAAGRLRAVKCGTRTLIPFAAGKAWLNGLPAMGT